MCRGSRGPGSSVVTSMLNGAYFSLTASHIAVIDAASLSLKVVGSPSVPHAGRPHCGYPSKSRNNFANASGLLCNSGSPAPFRGVLPLPFSALKSAWPVLGNPANRNRAIPLTYEQFRFGFANAVPESEAKELYETFAVPAAGAPLFQAAAANLNPWTEAKVDTNNPARGPLLIVSGERDHTVPWAIANASFKQQKGNSGVTEIVEMKNRGHALTIDSGWREVAATALTFVKRFV